MVRIGKPNLVRIFLPRAQMGLLAFKLDAENMVLRVLDLPQFIMALGRRSL
jgi:hypothetical protein